MENVIKNIKQALDTNYSINIKIQKGGNKLVKITSVARFRQADKNHFFCKWVTYDYANSVYRYLYGKNIDKSNHFQH